MVNTRSGYGKGQALSCPNPRRTASYETALATPQETARSER
jgi:hypothetical protein